MFRWDIKALKLQESALDSLSGFVREHANDHRSILHTAAKQIDIAEKIHRLDFLS